MSATSLRSQALRLPVPLTLGVSALGPAVLLSGLFALFAVQAKLPVFEMALLGAIGGPASLLFHEFGHLRAAMRLDGIRSGKISLVWLGAATRLEGKYATGREQARVAAAGPRASFLLALALSSAALFLPLPPAATKTAFALVFFNIALAVLNLVPAPPLDGHKVTIGLVWTLCGSEAKAKRVIRRIGLAFVAVEGTAALLLFFEKPALGLLAFGAGMSLYGQKWLVHKLRNSSGAA